MDVYELLRQDHQKIKDAIAKLMADDGDRAQARERLFVQTRNELLVHTEFENEIFYPAIAESPAARQRIEDALDEHDQVEMLLDEISDGEQAGPDFLNKLQKLQGMVLHHIDEEENQIFPLAQRTIDGDRAKEMGRQYRQQKQETLKKAS